MKDLKTYTESVTEDLDNYFATHHQTKEYKTAITTEKNILVSAAAVLSAREAAGLSQQKLADKAGIPKTTIVRIEHGNNTSIETLTKIATALGKQVNLSII
ncbi:hypothetical protein LFAB_03860 [Lactiplantibacillus fabifermentans T30PCM01]|uniref:HTH cro/C1-type domain-containing protein n=1 Tax=Lactiplantibacillus fabifermentans T30PCM01 TaxID=1400520 RepID=W6TAP7_9LACO|nr:helix-turn-helix transcriptional regulator [Lactiplantibacillus fabifermentans]ETY75038.1 hypothetical protein LFAB_03860 [Lactiplantibacillus fabifermentans T30PCM01]